MDFGTTTTTVWKFNGNSDGKWEEDTPLGRPIKYHRSYLINNEIFHVSANRTDRYYIFIFNLLIKRF